MNLYVEINKELAEKLLDFSIKKNTKFKNLEDVKKKIQSNVEDVLDYRVENCFNILKSTQDLGGTVGNCYNNDIHQVSGGDEQPFYYQEFLEYYEDNLTVKQYKKLLALMKDDIVTNSDYYGGSTSERIKEVQVEELSEILSDLGLFKTDEKVTFEDYFKIVLESEDFKNTKNVSKSKKVGRLR